MNAPCSHRIHEKNRPRKSVCGHRIHEKNRPRKSVCGHRIHEKNRPRKSVCGHRIHEKNRARKSLPADTSAVLPALKNIATRLRIDSVRATTEAGSGHPTTCCSAAEIMAALFFAEMRYDPANPQNPNADRFVLSKGHAAPILYAAWAEAGVLKG